MFRERIKQASAVFAVIKLKESGGFICSLSVVWNNYCALFYVMYMVCYSRTFKLLQCIKVYVELLCEIFKEKDDVTGVSYMQKLDGQVDRITELVSTLLDSARISEGQLKLNPIRFNMNELISRQIDDLKHLSRLHKLIFEPGKIQLVTADKERIEQVISNFLSNAIKYSPKGGEILITSKDDEEGGVRVCVKDKGIGIPANLKEKIFDRFFRINNPDVQTFPGI